MLPRGSCLLARQAEGLTVHCRGWSAATPPERRRPPSVYLVPPHPQGMLVSHACQLRRVRPLAPQSHTYRSSHSCLFFRNIARTSGLNSTFLWCSFCLAMYLVVVSTCD